MFFNCHMEISLQSLLREIMKHWTLNYCEEENNLFEKI